MVFRASSGGAGRCATAPSGVIQRPPDASHSRSSSEGSPTASASASRTCPGKGRSQLDHEIADASPLALAEQRSARERDGDGESRELIQPVERRHDVPPLPDRDGLRDDELRDGEHRCDAERPEAPPRTRWCGEHASRQQRQERRAAHDHEPVREIGAGCRSSQPTWRYVVTLGRQTVHPCGSQVIMITAEGTSVTR